jgi:hypothetical protein
MKTSDLTGAQLALWVARAEGFADAAVYDGVCAHSFEDTAHWPYAPHERWDEGGPIIERDKIALECPRGGQWEATAWTAEPDRKWVVAYGDTALVAAMRAFVAAKYGDDAPDEVG